MSKKPRSCLDGWAYYASYLAFAAGVIFLLNGQVAQRFVEAFCKLLP